LRPEELEEWRWNRLVRLHVNRAMIEMDAMCEMLNDHTKKMAKSDEIKTLKQKTLFVSLMRQCAHDLSTVCRTANAVKSSISPRQTLERKALTLLFKKAEIWLPSGRKLKDPFLWEYHEFAKMKSATTAAGELNEYEISVDRVFVNLANSEAEAISSEEMEEMMEEICEDSGTNENLLDGLVDPNDVDDEEVGTSATTSEEEGIPHNAINGADAYLDAPTVTDHEITTSDTVVDTSTAEEVLTELNNLTKYKLNTSALVNIRSKGLTMLGDNLRQERQDRIAREAREGAQIMAAVEHYHSNQQFRRDKRQHLINTATPKTKMSWEKKWESHCIEWGETRIYK
jgi:hypothetical protein